MKKEYFMPKRFFDEKSVKCPYTSENRISQRYQWHFYLSLQFIISSKILNPLTNGLFHGTRSEF
jgi:hypothetical protein